MKEQFFVTGIGTDVGKTVACAVLCKMLGAAYWKPVQTGYNLGKDSDIINALLNDTTIYPEAYNFAEPLSPHTASHLENSEIEFDKIQIPAHQGTLIIEGAGGIMVPLTRKNLIADWVIQEKLKCIVVSRHYLGSLNHTMTTLASMKMLGIETRGVLFVGTDNDNNESLICERFNMKNLGNIPETDQVDLPFIETTANKLRRFW
jgi:dethiobiotin synthetase